EDPAPRRARPLLHRELVGAARPLHPGAHADRGHQHQERLLMSQFGAADGRVLPAPERPAGALRGIVLWAMGFAGGLGFIEPSPYEIVALVSILLFALTGLSLRPA